MGATLASASPPVTGDWKEQGTTARAGGHSVPRPLPALSPSPWLCGSVIAIVQQTGAATLLPSLANEGCLSHPSSIRGPSHVLPTGTPVSQNRGDTEGGICPPFCPS